MLIVFLALRVGIKGADDTLVEKADVFGGLSLPDKIVAFLKLLLFEQGFQPVPGCLRNRMQAVEVCFKFLQ